MNARHHRSYKRRFQLCAISFLAAVAAALTIPQAAAMPSASAHTAAAAYSLKAEQQPAIPARDQGYTQGQRISAIREGVAASRGSYQKVIAAAELKALELKEAQEAAAHRAYLAKLAEERREAAVVKKPVVVASTSYPAHYGDYSYSGLEELWVSEGGSASAESTAACIAEHESGGNPNAISPTDDFGLWQVNGSWGAMASLNPYTNARSAITISHDGTNWSPWTTAPDCGV